jgi:ATP-dependent DNA ligase
MILYKLNNNNRLSWWKIEQDGPNYHVTWGQDNNTINNPTANHNAYETPSEERAAFEIQSKINEQINRKGYTEDKPKTVPDLPMLAQKWEDHVRKIGDGKRQPFQSVAIQPKLDGLRCITTNTTMTTRRAEQITSCPHITELLSHLSPEDKLDGELYIPSTDLQTIQSYVRRQRPHRLSTLIQYHVFDYIDLSIPFTERYNRLASIVDYLTEIHNDLIRSIREIPEKLRQKQYVADECPIKLVPTLTIENSCQSEQAKHLIKQHFKAFTKQGYEGCIIRNPQSLYELNYRSPDLLKYKQYQDDEFEIIDVSEGYGKTGIFVCKTEDGNIFEATPAWTAERKRYLLRNKEKYIGRFVTVQFEKYYKGTPLKTVAKCTREK